ncbi:PREDICTED: LRR receptor-like serine/threonine-protein kinase ERL2 [Camelina sativa]|uniref:LRR receptor-like serine/threonine-protein kinase ERL2 n=1 Tax=Camelina sativa TaxID=90675 RepID=A0ABM0T106_CAMSA|nr:PREDICTED: LRR receptor-like serine/threonine-protein kinase ERL2 [Camelina sativa]
MNLANNCFQGNLPSSLGNMKEIEFLDISLNNFYGKLPGSFLEGCYSLSFLKMSHNQLSGKTFLETANFTYLSVLCMDNNLFTGKIGDGLRSSRSLSMLDISNNSFSGVIPIWIGELPELYALLLSHNSLEGEIPLSLFNISTLDLLDLSGNLLSRGIPSLVNSRYLTVFLLQGNNLSGVVPDILLAHVAVLDLRDNRLSGNIPEFIKTQNISILLLRGNNLTGHIPHQLCPLSNIQLLDLSNNRLNGSIPSCLSNTSFGFGNGDSFDGSYFDYGISSSITFYTYFKSLIVEDQFSKDFKAETKTIIDFATKHRYDAYWDGNLKLLFGMDLSANELSGEIPVELGGLGEVQVLNLSNNKLSGVILEGFSALKKVESLDLSFNRFQGRIPPQLTDLSSLAVFNVSFNNLSGIIPEGRQFNTFDTQSYLGNPLLCGKPTNTSCERNNFQEPNNGVEADESTIDMVSFYWSYAAAYVTILLGLLASLSFDSPWSRAWFYIVDAFIHKGRKLL